MVMDKIFGKENVSISEEIDNTASDIGTISGWNSHIPWAGIYIDIHAA